MPAYRFFSYFGSYAVILVLKGVLGKCHQRSIVAGSCGHDQAKAQSRGGYAAGVGMSDTGRRLVASSLSTVGVLFSPSMFCFLGPGGVECTGRFLRGSSAIAVALLSTQWPPVRGRKHVRALSQPLVATIATMCPLFSRLFWRTF